MPLAPLRAPRALPVRARRRAKAGCNWPYVPAVSAETALTGITQNLYMPKTDAAEGELGFALQSNICQIAYDQRGRIKSFSRSAQATVGLPAMHETQSYTWDKNGNPSQISASLKAMVGVQSPRILCKGQAAKA